MKKLVFSFLVDFFYQKSVIQSVPLVKSIRNYGGILKDCDIMICHVGNLTDEYTNKLKEIDGLIFKQVEQFHKNHKHSNKLRVLEQPEIFDYEFLCILDCDTYMLGDISDYLTKGKLRMKISDGKTVSSETMKTLFSANNLDYPEEKYLTTLRQPTIAYCNNGVMICDTQNKRFFEIWLEKTKWICENQHLLGGSTFFSEQASLSLAIYESGIDYEELPITCNFPSHIGIVVPEQYIEHIKLIHYHGQMESGKLVTPYELINSKILA